MDAWQHASVTGRSSSADSARTLNINTVMLSSELGSAWRSQPCTRLDTLIRAYCMNPALVTLHNREAKRPQGAVSLMLQGLLSFADVGNVEIWSTGTSREAWFDMIFPAFSDTQSEAIVAPSMTAQVPRVAQSLC